MRSDLSQKHRSIREGIEQTQKQINKNLQGKVDVLDSQMDHEV